MIIKITADHIHTGVKGSSTHNPLALAIKEHFPEALFSFQSFAVYSMTNECIDIYEYDYELKRWLKDWAKDSPNKSFTLIEFESDDLYTTWF